MKNLVRLAAVTLIIASVFATTRITRAGGGDFTVVSLSCSSTSQTLFGTVVANTNNTDDLDAWYGSQSNENEDDSVGNGNYTAGAIYTFSLTNESISNGGAAGLEIGNILLATVGCGPDGYRGPAIPAGFVLRVMTCNTAVFDTPGGSPVGANAVTAGQTFFVNPKTAADAKATPWTEIFVSGVPNGFVPTSCVGGYPVNAPAGGQ